MDAVVDYTFLCQRRPSTYLEVGSGYSTMFARRAITDHDRPTRSDLSLLTRLEPGDVLVLDGTHTAFMNSDSVVAFLDVLPFINSGVPVVIDDIFLPSDYPPTWEGRWYGEQYLLATMLLAGAAGWTVRFPSWYVVNDSALAARLEPVWPDTLTHFGKVAKSFWIERQA